MQQTKKTKRILKEKNEIERSFQIFNRQFKYFVVSLTTTSSFPSIASRYQKYQSLNARKRCKWQMLLSPLLIEYFTWRFHEASNMTATWERVGALHSSASPATPFFVRQAIIISWLKPFPSGSIAPSSNSFPSRYVQLYERYIWNVTCHFMMGGKRLEVGYRRNQTKLTPSNQWIASNVASNYTTNITNNHDGSSNMR